MPRKTRPSAGKGPSQRGRHKKWKSRETRKWLRMFGRSNATNNGGAS